MSAALLNWIYFSFNLWIKGCFSLQISGKDCMALPSMDGNTAFSSVRNPQTIGSALAGERHMVSCPKIHPSNASNCSDVTDTKHETDYGSPILMQTPRPMNIPTGTKSAYSNPSLSSATDVICQVDKEATQEVKCRESSSGSVLDGNSHHLDSTTIADVHQKITGYHKENLLSFSISEPERGQKSVRHSCSTLGNLGAERMSLQNPCRVSSVTGIPVNCNTENMAGSVKSSRNASELANFVNLQKEKGQKIMSTNSLQLQENIGLEESNSTSVKGGQSNPWPPVIHTFSILKSEDKLESIDREQYGVPNSINNLPAAINNCPMKGLKHIPILYNSMEKIVHSQELTNNNNLCLSPSRPLHHVNKRKWSPTQRQQIADLVSYSPQPDFTSKYCFKRHKVFADKVETGHQNMKIPEGKEMAESVGFLPQEFALELNGNNTKNSSVNFRLGLSSPAHAAGQMSSLGKASQRMSSSESDWGKFLALSASSEPTQGAKLEKEIIANFEHRFNKLQAFLKRCDESDQYYSQGFQNLSAVDRSVIAVKLEKQAIKLSLEEVKEFDRMNTLKIFRKPSTNTTNDVGAALILKLLLPNSSQLQ